VLSGESNVLVADVAMDTEIFVGMGVVEDLLAERFGDADVTILRLRGDPVGIAGRVPRPVRIGNDRLPSSRSGMYRSRVDSFGFTPQPQDRDIRIATSRKQIFDYAHATNISVSIGDIGNEHIALPEAHLCLCRTSRTRFLPFNYAKDPVLEKLSGSMIAMAFTLEEGAAFCAAHAQQISLDAPSSNPAGSRQRQPRSGVGNIAPSCMAIIDDENVMARARARRKTLLNQTQPRAAAELLLAMRSTIGYQTGNKKRNLYGNHLCPV